MLVTISRYSQNISAKPNSQNRYQNPHFGKAYVNILSMADNHGTLTTLPAISEIIKTNFNKIFPEANSKSTLNIFSQVGDLFINPMKKGFFTRPNATSGDIQLRFFEKLILMIKSQFENKNFSTIYTPGNHCFEGGVKWLLNKIEKVKSFDTILTNATTIEPSRVVKQKIYKVADDKNPKLQHRLLVLGLTPQNLKFYTQNLNGISVMDSTTKTYAQLAEEDLTETIKELRTLVESFKKEHPKGAVLINAHVGEKISDIIAKKVSGINLILNGHDHKTGEHFVNGATIVSHGQNNDFINSINLFFDDYGNSSIKAINTFYTENVVPSDKNPILRFFKAILGKDTVPLLKLNDAGKTKCKFSIDGIRHSHNNLANFITDITQNDLSKTYPELNATGIISSTFRGNLTDGANNLEIMKVLDGSVEDLAEMNVAKVRGDSLIKILSENVQSNLESPDRNSIIQWSGIKIDKNKFANSNLNDAFRIRNNVNGEGIYQSIDANKIYQIALPAKYVQKYCPDELTSSFKPTGKTMNNIFIEYLRKNNYQLNINPEIYEKRIIE